jgi:hypothetical protein
MSNPQQEENLKCKMKKPEITKLTFIVSEVFSSWTLLFLYIKALSNQKRMKSPKLQVLSIQGLSSLFQGLSHLTQDRNALLHLPQGLFPLLRFLSPHLRFLSPFHRFLSLLQGLSPRLSPRLSRVPLYIAVYWLDLMEMKPENKN